MERPLIKKLLIVGYGRHGKDEAAIFLSRITRLRYAGSVSWAVLPLMADYLGVHPQIAWEERHQNRELWRSHCDELRRVRPTRLVEMALRSGDIVAGVRGKEELLAIKESGIFDWVVWIHRTGFPGDPTVEFSPDDCDEIILNQGSLADYHLTLTKWASEASLLK